jgi:hypothetical protein
MLRFALLLAGFSALLLGCGAPPKESGPDQAGTYERQSLDAQQPGGFDGGWNQGQGYQGKPANTPPQSSY